MSTTTRGGIYRNKRGQLVNANGKPVEAPKAAETDAPTASEAAATLAAENDLDLATVTGTGANGNITKGDVEKALAAKA